jgi:hypothetical protein
MRQENKSIEPAWRFWAMAVGLGVAAYLAEEPLFKVWLEVKPKPSTVGRPLLGTVLEPIATWVPFLFLELPSIFLIFGVAIYGGWRAARRPFAWGMTSLGVYALFGIVFRDNLWWFVAGGAYYESRIHLVNFGPIAMIQVLMCLIGVVIGVRLRPRVRPLGHCVQCGYSLFGLPSRVCPECGTAFDSEITIAS